MTTPLSRWPMHRLVFWIEMLQTNPTAVLLCASQTDEQNLKKFFPEFAGQIRFDKHVDETSNIILLDGDVIKLPDL